MTPLTKILDHVARALGRLAAQFADKTLITGMISALIDEVQALEDGLWGILLTRDIDNAQTGVLDLIGKLVGAPLRGSRTDAQYRDRVKAQVIINRSSGGFAEIYEVARRVIEAWAVPSNPRIIEDPIAGYTIGCYPVGSIVNSTTDARELGIILDDMSSAGVHGIVLSQAFPASQMFCFQHGPGLGFGHGHFAGAYDGGVKS